MTSTNARPAPAPLMSVDEARARILSAMRLLPAERVPLRAAAGRVLAQDLVALLSHPPNPVSAMDGYALRADDAQARPLRLRVIGISRAGERFAGTVPPGACVRIFTGAMVPEGADTIALQEDATVDGAFVELAQVAAPGRHIRKAGLDFAAGQTCLPAGRLLAPRSLGLIASTGHADVSVRRRPRIAILATGDELVEVGTTPGPDQIIGSNSIGLAAMVAGWGGEPVDLGIAADRTDAIADALDRAAGCDMLVTTGGVSVGDHDLVHAALRQRGFALDFWRIAMRPGKPLMFGRLGALPVLGMPGNPIATLVCAVLFLRPAMAAMTGMPLSAPPLDKARLAVALAANDQREDYVRASLGVDADGNALVRPFARQDNSALMTLAHVEAFIRRAPFSPAAEAGETVDVIRLDRIVNAC